MSIVLDGTSGITNDSGYTGDGVSFADSTPANTLVTTSGGNVGIGTSSPSAAKLVVRSGTGTAHTVLGNDYGSLYLETASGGPNRITSLNSGLSAGQALAFNGSGGTEWGRFDSSGNLLVGATSGGKRLCLAGSNNIDVEYRELNSSVTWNVGPVGGAFSGRFNWYNATSAVDRMYLTTAGALYNSTGTYATISDVSLKENIVDATPKLEDVMRLRVRNYNMKADPEKRKVIGVVAQELEEVFPGLVEETVNRVALEDGTFEENAIKAVKYSVLTTILIKAIQELKAINDAQAQTIESLTARVAALEQA